MVGVRDFADLRPKIRQIYVPFEGPNFEIVSTCGFELDLRPPLAPFIIGHWRAVADNAEEKTCSLLA
jgi:hypothetical protein